MIVEYAKALGLVGFAGWSAYRGFFKQPGVFMSWPMFSQVSFFRVGLTCDATSETVIPWGYMIHMDFGGGVYELEEFLKYLEEVHGTKVSGTGVIADPHGYRPVEVRSSSVASQ